MGFYNLYAKWTPKEVRFLEKHYRTYPTEWIAGELGRSHHSVYRKAGNLGLKKVNPATLKKLAERRAKARRVRARRGR